MSSGSPETLVVALSGGVDSATAAALLVEQGHRVIGLTLRLYDARGTVSSAGGRCCGPRDIEDARRVAAHLGIPFYVVDHEAEFQRAVVDDFVAEYVAGRTPNPCVRCNEQVKFGPLMARARALGARRLATGHYARLEPRTEGAVLRRAVDLAKDQSYFLFAMPRELLGDILFPLGELTKDQVRDHARRLGLPNAAKAESQEICFVPDGDHAGFVERRAGDRLGAGEIVDLEGSPRGEHAGVHRFTVGQRRGLGRSFGAPAYVVGVDALTRRVTVGPREALGRRTLRLRDVRWIEERTSPFVAGVQVRHRHAPQVARVSPGRPQGAATEVELEEPVVAAPGQAAVLYDQDRVIGGGWID